MIKQGLLDKHGKPNEKTPADYLSSSGPSMDTTDSKKIKKEKAADFVIPSAGPEPIPKRKVCGLRIFEDLICIIHSETSEFVNNFKYFIIGNRDRSTGHT